MRHTHGLCCPGLRSRSVRAAVASKDWSSSYLRCYIAIMSVNCYGSCSIIKELYLHRKIVQTKNTLHNHDRTSQMYNDQLLCTWMSKCWLQHMARSGLALRTLSANVFSMSKQNSTAVCKLSMSTESPFCSNASFLQKHYTVHTYCRCPQITTHFLENWLCGERIAQQLLREWRERWMRWS